MAYLLLLLTVVVSSVQSIFSKQYSIRTKKPNMVLFASVSAFFAMLFFVISSGFKLNFNPAFLPYSFGFAAAYAAAIGGSALAIQKGPLSISALLNSYSLIIPTAYGILFLEEELSPFSYIGFLSLFLSLFLINMKKEEMKLSLAWLICVLIGFVGNGMCSTVQKMQQLAFDGNYKNEFMIVALLTASVLLFILGTLTGKASRKTSAVQCLRYAPFQGIANGIVNLLVMILGGKLANSVLFPSISAGGITLTFCAALFIYREKLSRLQMIGYALGVVSIIFLNL